MSPVFTNLHILQTPRYFIPLDHVHNTNPFTSHSDLSFYTVIVSHFQTDKVKFLSYVLSKETYRLSVEFESPWVEIGFKR